MICVKYYWRVNKNAKGIDNLKDSNVELTLKLHRSESCSKEMRSKLAEIPKILHQIEDENVENLDRRMTVIKCDLNATSFARKSVVVPRRIRLT